MASEGARQNPDLDGLHLAIKLYFDGFYESDADKLGEIFHESASLYVVENGVLKATPIDQYLTIVRSREPVDLKLRIEKILSVTFAGADVAVARVAVANAAIVFDDCLTMVRHGARWQIIAKAYCASAKV